MHDLWFIIFEYAQDFYLNIDPDNLVDWSMIWTRLVPFIYAAVFMIVWVIVLGMLRSRIIRKTGLIAGKRAARTVHQHFSLRPIDPAIFAQRFGVPQSQLEQWQNMVSVDVEIDEQTDVKTVTASQENAPFIP